MPHQEFGTFYSKVKRNIKGYNPKKDIYVNAYRSRIEKVDGDVILNFLDGRLVLKDDLPFGMK